MTPSRILLMFTCILSLSITSCNNHEVSEKVRNEIEQIDWKFDKIEKVNIYGSASCGGSLSSDSTFSLSASLIAPSGSILPDDSVDIIIEKITTAVKKAGAQIIIAENDNGINYTKYSKNFDESAYIFKIIYNADGNVGSIIGTLIKRRYSDDDNEQSETVGQLLISLHEER